MHESWEDLGETHHFLFLYILNSVAYGIQFPFYPVINTYTHTHPCVSVYVYGFALRMS